MDNDWVSLNDSKAAKKAANKTGKESPKIRRESEWCLVQIISLRITFFDEILVARIGSILVDIRVISP